jgi:hypothetical protein
VELTGSCCGMDGLDGILRMRIVEGLFCITGLLGGGAGLRLPLLTCRDTGEAGTRSVVVVVVVDGPSCVTVVRTMGLWVVWPEPTGR